MGQTDSRNNLTVLLTGAVILVAYAVVALRLQSSPPPSATPEPTPEPASTLQISPTPSPTPVPQPIPAPLTVLPPPSGIGGGRPGCKTPLVVIVYSDDNRDQLPSPGEAVSGVQVILTDSTYSRLGSAYTKDGKAEFCLPEGKMFYVDLPYFQMTRAYQPHLIHQGGGGTLEIRIDPPILPARLP